jgi:hypothetical protein
LGGDVTPTAEYGVEDEECWGLAKGADKDSLLSESSSLLLLLIRRSDDFEQMDPSPPEDERREIKL